MIPKITQKQMLAARMGVEDHTDKSICQAVECTPVTLNRWRDDPEFQAYEETVRHEHNCRLQAATQVECKKYKITLAGEMTKLNDIDEKLEAMAQLPLNTDKLSPAETVRIHQARTDVIKVKIELLKLTAATAIPEDEKPDVYQPEWMQ